MITEKQRIGITLANFIIMIIFVVTSSAYAVAWKTSIEGEVKHNSGSILKIESVIDDIQDGQIKTETSLAEIKTDLKWIRAALENK